MSCEVCGKKADAKCSGCGLVFYCSKEHQKSHWLKHKETCLPFSIEEDEIVGRHLVCRRFVGKGEILLKERPLVSGPPQSTGPVCLGCYTSLTPSTSTPCPDCGWPLCLSDQCYKSPNHRAECHWAQVKKKGKVKISQFVSPHPTYACILPLRFLYQRWSNPTAWSRLLTLESHSCQRAQTKKHEEDRFGVANLLHRFYNLQGDFSEDEILNICGIIQINGHEVPLSGNGYVAIYWRGSLVEHSCRPTCNKSFTSSGELLLRGAENLSKGSRLSICYTDPMWGTPHRRHHLAHSKFFWCRCQRCSDPTEFGTYTSAIKCTSGSCPGKMLPPTFLIDDVGVGPEWVCEECGKSDTENGVGEVLAKLGGFYERVNKNDPVSLNTFLQKADSLVPENHYQVTEISIALAQLYGQVNPGGLKELDEESLQHKEILCKRLLKLTEQLVPAEYRLRGVLYFELHASVAEKTRRLASINGTIDSSDIHNQLLESKTYLDRCWELLKYEPDVLPEGKIAKQALENMKELDNLLKRIQILSGNLPTSI